MAIGYSLHIGINRVDESVYHSKYDTLTTPENDANYYHSLASSKGYVAELLRSQEAKADDFINRLKSYALDMIEGDRLFISYSGHGTRVPDLDGDEESGKDQAMVFYDRLLIDDELKKCWSRFNSGVKIFMLTDSCYNGTVSRYLIALKNLERNDPAIFETMKQEKSKLLGDFRRSLTEEVTAPGELLPAASCALIHIAAAQDDQQAEQGEGSTSDFTTSVKDLVEQGFQGSYKEFFNNMVTRMPFWQKPNWDTLAGVTDTDFENSPFLAI